ncbi:MAG: DUF475 domain-containing protein [Patulibacter minatonensis]
MSALRTFRIPVAITFVAVIAATILGGPEVGLIVALLAVLEISISFDNAIVNAHVLKSMTPKWQQIFLTWGILIAVFGMRLVFPIVIVAAASGLGIPDVLDQAINQQDLYARNLEEANTTIAAFGGTFLLMVFLNFFFDADKDHHWAGFIERPLAAIGRIDAAPTAIAGAVLLLVSQVVGEEYQHDVLVSGLAGLVIYLFVSGLADNLEPEDEDDAEADEDEIARSQDTAEIAPSRADASRAAIGAAAKGGFATFMYLEVLDASFSFDGVIGAFAISKDIFVIAVGLGLGAIYIRTLTVYLVRQGTLSEYRYLEHGAHWAIGVLAALLFIGIEHHVPEVITGCLGAGLIIAAFLSSLAANRRDAREAASATPTT